MKEIIIDGSRMMQVSKDPIILISLKSKPDFSTFNVKMCQLFLAFHVQNLVKIYSMCINLVNGKFYLRFLYFSKTQPNPTPPFTPH